MEYHRPQLKRFARISVAEARPRAWLVTVLFLLLCAMVSALFGFLAPTPLEGLFDPITEALESAAEYAAESGDVEWALETFERALESELMEDILEDGKGARLEGTDHSIGTLFLKRLLTGSVLAGLFAWLLSAGAGLINAVLNYGYHSYCLGVFRRQDPSAGELFSGFPHILTVLGSHIMVSIFSFLWSALGLAVGGGLITLIILVLPNEVGMILAAIIWLAMVCFIAVMVLQYALTSYIVMEEPEVGVFNAIRRSKYLMRGNTLRLFVLELSFLGWVFIIAILAVTMVIIGVVVASLVISVLRMVLIAGLVLAVAVGAALLVPLPLALWLTTYWNVALAGFYHIVSFVDDEEYELDETMVLEPVTEQDEPVWLNADEEEILPPYEDEQEEDAEVIPEEETPSAAEPADSDLGEQAEEPEPEEAPAEEPSAEEENKEQ